MTANRGVITESNYLMVQKKVITGCKKQKEKNLLTKVGFEPTRKACRRFTPERHSITTRTLRHWMFAQPNMKL